MSGGPAREIVLDTETTGIEIENGHRVVEIGAVELLNHVPSGRTFHAYVNPERDMPEDAQRVHGLTSAFLRDQPVFAEVADDLLTFLDGSSAAPPTAAAADGAEAGTTTPAADVAKLIAHNASFDLGFLNMELGRIGRPLLAETRVIDTLVLARQRFPNAANSLDALCRRYEIDLAARTQHGALLDAQLLADVYLMLIGGRQPDLGLTLGPARRPLAAPLERPLRPPRPHAPSPAELAAHTAFLDRLNDPIWRH